MKIGSISIVGDTELFHRGRKIYIWLLFLAVVYALTRLAWPVASTSRPVSELTDPIPAHESFEAVAAPPASELVPDASTTPRLILAGVLNTGATRSSALIVSDSGEERTFFVGDVVHGIAKLKAVYADRVLLESERGLTTLKLRSDVRIGNVPVPQGPAETSTQSDVAATAEYFTASISPTGDLLGYRLSPSVREPLLQQWGLQPDDIIVAIHGLSLLQSDNRARAVQRFKSHEFASVTIIRDGNKLINITMMNAEDPKTSE